MGPRPRHQRERSQINYRSTLGPAGLAGVLQVSVSIGHFRGALLNAHYNMQKDSEEQVSWPNGKASDYESGDCRFESGGDQLLS